MYNAGDITDFLDQLDSRDEVERASAEETLTRAGIDAISELIDALDAAAAAESAVGTIRNMRAALAPLIPVVFVLYILVGGCLLPAIGCVAVGGAVVWGWLKVRARGWTLAARRGAHARTILDQITDTAAIDPLAERFSHGYRICSPEGAWALARLLPSLPTGGWKRKLPEKTRRNIAQVLVVSNADDHPQLLTAVLSAMAQADDPRALYNARMIASSSATTSAEQQVIQAANEYIHAIEQSAERRRANATLLRAANSPPEELLRPASSSDTDDSTLLRPAATDSTPDGSP